MINRTARALTIPQAPHRTQGIPAEVFDLESTHSTRAVIYAAAERSQITVRVTRLPSGSRAGKDPETNATIEVLLGRYPIGRPNGQQHFNVDLPVDDVDAFLRLLTTVIRQAQHDGVLPPRDSSPSEDR